jgi:hypothetical protein
VLGDSDEAVKSPKHSSTYSSTINQYFTKPYICKMRKTWIKIRKIGKRNFIISLSLLLGLLMAGFSSIVHMVIDNHYDFSLFYSGGSLGMFVGGTLGGLLFSYSQWEINENKFKKQNDG